MKKFGSFLLMVVLVLVSATTSLAYVSDRHDFGEIDFEGATVTYVTHMEGILDEFREGGIYAGRLEEAKEKFNIGAIELEVVDYFDVGEAALNRYLAGDSQYDFWVLPQGQFWSAARQDALFPVNEILPDSYFEKLPPITRSKNEALRIDDKLFHFSAGGADDYSDANVVILNLDIFERDNLGDPFEMYRNKDWTWEKYEEIARKATRDTTGDGQIDQWGSMSFGPGYMISSNGGKVVSIEDGRVEFAMDEPRVIEALRTYYRWNHEENFIIGDWQGIEFPGGYVAMMPTGFWVVNDKEYDFSYAVLPLPMGPDVDDYVYTPGGPVIMSQFLPKNSAYPEGMIALDNFLFPLDEYWEKFDEQCAVKSPDRISYEVMRNTVDKVGDIANYHEPILGNEWDVDKPFGAIIAGVNEGRSPATVVNEVKDQAQKLLDEAHNQ